MSDEKTTAEPSGASGGSGVCPYVTGTVTRYCTLTPFTLTYAERDAVETAMNAYGLDNANPECAAIEATLWGLLERTK